MTFLRLMIASFGLVSLMACSGKPIKVYEGAALEDEQEVMLIAGGNIEVTHIDGKKMKQYLLSNVETRYALSPGKHEVVFNYTSVWAKPKAGPDGEKAELVESGPQVMEFDVAAGTLLSFEFAELDNLRQAREFADNFSAFLKDQSGEAVAVSKAFEGQIDESGQIASTAATQAAKASDVVAASSTQVDQSLPALEAMKLLWDKATAEDKKTFLKWAFK